MVDRKLITIKTCPVLALQLAVIRVKAISIRVKRVIGKVLRCGGAELLEKVRKGTNRSKVLIMPTSMLRS